MAKQAEKNGESFFYLVYFAGHGVILTDTNNPTI